MAVVRRWLREVHDLTLKLGPLSMNFGPLFRFLVVRKWDKDEEKYMGLVNGVGTVDLVLLSTNHIITQFRSPFSFLRTVNNHGVHCTYSNHQRMGILRETSHASGPLHSARKVTSSYPKIGEVHCHEHW